MNPGGLLDMTENMLGGILGAPNKTQKAPVLQPQPQPQPQAQPPKRDAASEYQVIGISCSGLGRRLLSL